MDNVSGTANDRLQPEDIEKLVQAYGVDLLRAFIQVGPYLNQLTRDDVQLSVSDRKKVLYHVSASSDGSQLPYGTLLAPDGAQYNAMKVGRRFQAAISIQDTGVPLYSVALPICGQDGQVVGSVMLSTDVTEAMRREQELTHASRRLQALHAVSTAISQSLDLDQVFQIALDTTLKVMGLDMGVAFLLDDTRNELVFKYHHNMVPELVESFKKKNLPLNEGIAGRVAQTGTPELIVDVNDDPNNIQRTGVQRQGNRSLAVIPLKTKARVWGTMSVGSREQRTFSEAEFELLTAIGAQIGIAIENAHLYQTVRAQLEELKRTQAQLVQAAKLSAVGQLVAGLAHELNNPLTAVIGYTQLLQESVSDPEIRQDLDRIHEDAQRSARIVRNLLVFARQKESRHQYASLNEAIEQTLTLRAFQFREDHIDVELDFAKNLPNTMFDVSQLQQVFLAVMNNAHDSMLRAHGQGKLIIRTSVIKDGDVPYVRVEFIDDGLGLPQSVLDHLFEPFFTTKDVGEGMGLGLSISYGIVQEHNGRISAENRKDGQKGACFSIDIPVSVSGPEQPLLRPVEVESRRKNRVLIIDDEQAIVSLVTRLLNRKGFDVDSATSGEVALRRLQEHNYDLIISDIKMPGMGGRTFYERVAEKDPALARRIVFSTGDIGNPETRAFLAETHNYSINKPFNLRQVEEVVEKALQDLV
ncbi:MAG: GAF domain-containing protein [Anaerolineae bacterium]|nr:GAF domain-containing protein [Anaerolineae bacterium]